MELLKLTRLPMITMESSVVGTRDLQKISSKSLGVLAEKGPQVVAINGIKKAVLVDYDQYIHFQDTFRDIFKKMSIVNQILPLFPPIPDSHRFDMEELRLEISGTLRKIVAESPESSPFADLMDAILGVASGLFGKSESAPVELKRNAQGILGSSAQKVKNTNARPKRNLTE